MIYRVLVADPPWSFDDTLPGLSRGAAANYPCLSIDALRVFPLPPLAPDATLFLWRVASMQQEALDVVKAWGFSPVKSEIVWRKLTKHGKRWFGMGRTVRAEHEICLIAHRGKPRTESHSIRSTFETDPDVDGLDAVNTRHSAKPDLFYEIVEQLREGPYVELFARRQRPGWTCLGNEVVPTVSALDLAKRMNV